MSAEHGLTRDQLRAGQEAHRASGTPMSLALWLAAHDAEVRKAGYDEAMKEAAQCGPRGVVAEEPEWEYIHLIGEPPIQMAIKSTPERATHKRMPRRVIEPGPWVPVKQEGATDG